MSDERVIYDDTFWDGLSSDEGEYGRSIIEELKNAAWAQPILKDLGDPSKLDRSKKDKLFELRFGFAVHKTGVEILHEVAGESESTIDFGFTLDGQSWLVEMMRLGETNAVKAATTFETDSNGVTFSARALRSPSADSNQDEAIRSEEAETLKAVERICQKCERDGRPHKFPPIDGSLRAILVDLRTFLHGGDKFDKIHIGIGGRYLKSEFHQRRWKGRLISGVFDDQTESKGAPEARERLHFLSFVNEKKFDSDAFGNSIEFVANPYLFKKIEAADAAISTWPLQPAKIINR